MAATRFIMVKKPPDASIRHQVIRTEVVKRLHKLGDTHIRKRYRLMSTWEKSQDKPQFRRFMLISTNRIVMRITLEAPPAEGVRGQITVWRLLDKGTKKRPMMMTPDFQAKTSPRVTTSRPGSGGRSHLDNANPAPGITARQFDDTINLELEPDLIRAIQDGYREGFKKAR